jgi:hypothetical protein
MSKSTLISRVNALVLLAGGMAMLFAPDVVLPRLVAGFPPAGLWLGQLLGAAWLGFAALSWLSQGAVLGGIYGRPVVMANAVMHFIGAMALLRTGLFLYAAPVAILAVVYCVLLLRGPLAGDMPGDQPRG